MIQNQEHQTMSHHVGNIYYKNKTNNSSYQTVKDWVDKKLKMSFELILSYSFGYNW